MCRINRSACACTVYMAASLTVDSVVRGYHIRFHKARARKCARGNVLAFRLYVWCELGTVVRLLVRTACQRHAGTARALH